MASGLLGIGVSGLLATQRSLNTISQNIANVNTEGYSRQSVQLSARAPQAAGFGFSGAGVDVVSIRRAYDAFIESSVRGGTSATAENTAFHKLAAQLDNVLADADAGMSAAIQRFFNAVQDVANAPSTPAARQVMFSQARQLAEQFNQLGGYIEDLRGQVNHDIRSSVNEINRLTANIAELNRQVVLARGSAGGQPPNDLLDQRDSLIRQLSDYVQVNTLEQDDGAINVLVGKGQLLVRGNHASALKVVIKDGDADQLGVSIDGGNGADVPVTGQLIGGRLGGVFAFRDRMLDAASNSLGRVAIGIGEKLNEQNRAGMDLDGALGIDMFRIGQPEVRVRQGSAGNVSVSFDDVTQLSNQDYTLRYDGASWDLVRNDTGASVSMTGSGTAADPFIADGIAITVNAAPAAGDSYVIRPTRRGAVDMQMTLANSRQIAAAAPVRSAANSANTGSGVISPGVVSDIDNAAFQTTPGQLTPPLLIRFSGATSYDVYDNSNPAAPVLLEGGIAYDPATGADLFPTPGGLDYGYRMRLTGAPAAGDRFTTEYNTGGVGDNRNALLMAGLADEKLLQGGSASFAESYNGLVADVGAGTRQVELNAQAQKRLLDQTLATRESISGVNLDDEAANLVRFQQAYQASAQVIATASTLFDTLLGAVRR